jgi:hypothetical protein
MATEDMLPSMRQKNQPRATTAACSSEETAAAAAADPALVKCNGHTGHAASSAVKRPAARKNSSLQQNWNSSGDTLYVGVVADMQRPSRTCCYQCSRLRQQHRNQQQRQTSTHVFAHHQYSFTLATALPSTNQRSLSHSNCSSTVNSSLLPLPAGCPA